MNKNKSQFVFESCWQPVFHYIGQLIIIKWYLWFKSAWMLRGELVGVFSVPASNPDKDKVVHPDMAAELLLCTQ